jgi:hypothetical protein
MIPGVVAHYDGCAVAQLLTAERPSLTVATSLGASHYGVRVRNHRQ